MTPTHCTHVQRKGEELQIVCCYCGITDDDLYIKRWLDHGPYAPTPKGILAECPKRGAFQ